MQIFCALCVLCCTAFGLDRGAFTFTRYDLRARVTPAQQGFAVQGRLSLRNDSTQPQAAIALQISSTLVWKSVQLAGKRVTYVTDTYTSDVDHTGAVSEAVVTLPAAVPPKGTIDIDVEYAGTIPADATRLTNIGVPADVATHNDWDRITSDFTGVRGAGYVCWYPVAMDALQSESAAMFATLGEWRQRHEESSLHLLLTVVSDQSVVTNGRLVEQQAHTEAEGPVQEREYDFSPMGFVPPTFAIANYTLLSRPEVNVFHFAGQQAGAQEYALAAQKLLPLITDWLGAPREKIAVVGLPTGYTPFDSGAMLFTPLTQATRESTEVVLAHTLAHAAFSSSRLWISEGLAHFAQVLVRQQQAGRRAALAYLQQFRPALAEAEKQAAAPAAQEASAAGPPSDTPRGEPLIRATDEVFYRTKAMFVWWMLRDMVGDQALQHALRAYRSAEDKEPAYVQRLVEKEAKRQLESFFDDWVYRDRGLPDFRIVSAYARKLLPENYTITVTVENTGKAGAEVPVYVPLQNGEAQQRVMVNAQGKAVARIQVPGAPAEAVVNDGSVPEANVADNRAKVTTSQ